MQIKNLNSKKLLSYVLRLSDMRFASQVLFVVIVLLVSWSGIKTIQANYGLQKQISALKQKNTVQKLENDNLALQNQYFNSNQYLELAARQNLGLAMPGEKEVIVPASVANNYTVDLKVAPKTKPAERKTTFVERNLSGWLDFFLHRTPDN